ncbi:hypothetical protein N7G274_001989 [Stereocaulon virgatum]|uniref:DNA replication factor Cdt1 C-terminal domain-containing protein n=1 Tax=Stereocaulon virgatum TaxID=373712 RepID=A0ABR4AL36_9LECA
MALATKRRKIGATATTSLTAPATQRGIQAFGRISKSQVQIHGKSALVKASIIEDINGKSELSTQIAKKRKLESIQSDAEKQETNTACSTTEPALPLRRCSNAISDPSSHVSRQLPSAVIAQPITPRKRVRFAEATIEKPTKGARSRLETLSLPPSSPSTSSSPSSSLEHDTPPSSPASASHASPRGEETNRLPEELQDLINLHSSYLTALSLHYAHNGSMTPADLRNLGPGVERAWRKRRVTTDDIQKILALEQTECADDGEESGPLYLSDYGSGKVCVEIADFHTAQKAQGRPVNEEVLNAVFSRNLERQWISYKATQQQSPSPTDFIASLPLLPITPCASLSKIAPLVSKGQRRLEDLKAGAIRAQQRPLSTTSANATTTPQGKAKQTCSRSTNLLSRIKAKQLHQSTLPLPQSKELLARKAALQRLPEIAPVLESLAVSSKTHANDDAVAEIFKWKVAHVSFTMPTLIQHLQMSLRNPIGKEEAVTCVRLLAEVVPDWISVREVGKIVGVTVRGEGVDRREMGRIIERMVAKV